MLKSANKSPIKMNTIPPTFYLKPANGDLDLFDLKLLLIDRYLLLKEVQKKKDISTMQSVLEKFSWSNPDTLNSDVTSYFYLCMAMCETDADLNFFTRIEAKLFSNRVQKGNYDMFATLKELGAKVEKFNKVTEEIVDVNSGRRFKVNKEYVYFNNVNANRDEEIYYVPFENALQLLTHKNYYVHKGFIFIPHNELPKLLESIFIERHVKIIKKLKLHKRSFLQKSYNYEALTSFRANRIYIEEKEAKKEAENLPMDQKLRTVRDVDTLYSKLFPPCMQEIQKHMLKESHLNHQGRLQYTFFLKDCGLPLDEALEFFKKKYENKCDNARFEKEYAYGIRHAYGSVGAHNNNDKKNNYIIGYSCYSCMKIITFMSPNSKEAHGCPFKYLSPENLKRLLVNDKINSDFINEILAEQKKTGYQICCRKYFESKFNEYGDKIGINPMHYFKSAVKIMKEHENKKKPKDNKMDVEK